MKKTQNIQNIVCVIEGYYLINKKNLQFNCIIVTITLLIKFKINKKKYNTLFEFYLNRVQSKI